MLLGKASLAKLRECVLQDKQNRWSNTLRLSFRKCSWIGKMKIRGVFESVLG